MNALPTSPLHRVFHKFSRSGIDGTRILMKSDTIMDHPNANNSDLVKNSVLYREFLAEREEILVHKWLESEKAGHDIGFERALLDWIVKHRSAWRDKRRQDTQGQQK
jgi:hypothetical protein